MSFDTSWDIDEHKSIHEPVEFWQFKQAFLIANKHKYPRDRLLTLAHIYMNVEFNECTYPKPTMDLIKNLSKDFADDMKRLLNFWPRKVIVTDSNTGGAKDNDNAQTGTTSKMDYSTPFESGYIIPGFILRSSGGENPIEILKQSCSFSGIEGPEIVDEQYQNRNQNLLAAKLYIEKKLIAVAYHLSSKKIVSNEVSQIAYDILKELCFTIEVKEIDEQSQISRSDIVNNSKLSTFNYEMDYNKELDNNVGSMILKNMGWKVGDGLGKNNQGITSPIKIIHHSKRVGLGVVTCETNRANLEDFEKQAKKYILRFLNGPKKRLSFSIEFTKDEREIIHCICSKLNLKTKSRGQQGSRQLVVIKKQSLKEIFYELSNCSNFENDCYILRRPPHTTNN